MAQVSQPSAELARDLLQLARALVGAARNWTLYPPEHPAVGQSLDRLGDAVRQASNGAIFVVGVTPDTLMIEGASADRNQSAIAETAALLHDRDILELAFVGEVPTDALRGSRPYRQGLATARIRAIMGEQGNPAFNQPLLKRFVNLMGLFPVGNLVRLNTEELAVVTAEHPADPFRPQVRIISNAEGELIEELHLANTWEHDGRGEHPRAVVEALDPEPLGIDTLKYL